MSEHGSDTSDISMYADIATRPFPTDGDGKPKTYTNCVTDTEKCWLCPKCTWRKGSLREWAFRVRGYWHIPKNYAGFISRGYEEDWLERLYFVNPSGVTRCMNEWNDGFSGSHCTFDRAVIERFHDSALDVSREFGTRIGLAMASCAECSFHPNMLYQDPELRAYVLSLTDTSHAKVLTKAPYVQEEVSPWHDHPRVLRAFLYNDTAESLRCTTNKFGAGLRKERRVNGEVIDAASKDTKCSGHYGGPVTFWMEKNEEDGSIQWFEWDWIPELRDYREPSLAAFTDDELHDALDSESSSQFDYDQDEPGGEEEVEVELATEMVAGEVLHFSAYSSS
jgi:hypothetical protein